MRWHLLKGQVLLLQRADLAPQILQLLAGEWAEGGADRRSDKMKRKRGRMALRTQWEMVPAFRKEDIRRREGPRGHTAHLALSL